MDEGTHPGRTGSSAGAVAQTPAPEARSGARRGAAAGRPAWALGSQLRAERNRLGLSARELARRLDVSPSLVSQIETGRIQPSVRTLYAMVNALGVSVDELFAAAAPALTPEPLEPGTEPAEAPAGGRGNRYVQRRDRRRVIELQSGVRWESLTTADEREVEFVRATYAPGGASSPDGKLVRHEGREFGLVLSGRLHVTVGFEECVLEAGDSISFPSNIPHRLSNDGDEVVEAVWVVVGQ